MKRIVMAGLIVTLGVSAAFAGQEAAIQQVQFRGSPGGGCPDGYDFNFDNGRCYPNGYRAPGTYRPPPTYQRDYYQSRRNYGRPQGGGCPDGYAYNYSDGQCYPNGRLPPGTYAR